MGLEFATPEPISSDLGGSANAAAPGLDTWIGDVLLACDAARAAGIVSDDIPSSPSVSSPDDSYQSARQLAPGAGLSRPAAPPLAVDRRAGGGLEPRGAAGRPQFDAGALHVAQPHRLGRARLGFSGERPDAATQGGTEDSAPESLASDRHRGRFLREARALARLDHPGIVPIYDFGESGSVCYLATAHIEGPNLAEWLARQPEHPSPDMAAKLLLSLAEAIAHAHSRGVLHLDLKPGNVLMDRCDNPVGRTPRITDFGLAKLQDETRDETRTETLPFGTPRYMAPEQAASDRSQIGPATDVYGLGAILHTILAGTALDGPIDARPPNVVSRPPLPEALHQILARCLERSPQDRYLTVEALAEDLRRFVAGQSVIAPRMGRGKLRRAWDELKVANRVLIVCVLLLVGSLAVGGIVVSARMAFPDLNPATPLTRSEAPATGVASVAADPREERYTREMRNAYRLIRDNHDTATADSERLDRWAGPFSSGESDPRGFEWGYLKNFGHREWLTLRHGKLPDGKPSALYHVRFSPDGARLVTAGKDGTARVWDAATGRCLKVLDHRGIEVNSAAFSADGKSVATASDDGFVRLWDAASGEVKRRFSPPYTDAAHAALFTPDGNRLVSASRDGRLVVWNASTGEELWRRDAQVGAVEVLAISSDGSFAAAGGTRDGRIAILNLSDFSQRWQVRAGSGIIGLTIAPDNRLIAVNSFSEVALVDLTSRSPEVRLSGHHGGVESVAFTPDQSVLASVSGGDDHSVKIWEPATGRLRDVMPGHSQHNFFVTVSPDGKRLATASADGTTKLWELTRRTDRTTIRLPAGTMPLDIAVSFESKSANEFDRGSLRLVTIDKDGRLIRLDGDDGHTLETRALFPKPIVAARIAPFARSIAAVSADGVLVIADVAGDRAPVYLGAERVTTDPRGFAFDFTGRILAALSRKAHSKNTDQPPAGPIMDEKRIVIETATGRVASRLPGLSASFPTAGFAFFADGRRLAAHHAAGGDGIVVWDLVDGLARATPGPWKARRISALAVSLDGKLVATGDLGDRIKLQDAETLSLKSELLGHRDEISSLAFSPDSRRLASGDISGAVKLWDVASGEELLELEGVVGGAHFLQFAPDGLSLVAATLKNGGRFVIWHGRPHRSESP